MVKLYIINKISGKYLYEDFGPAADVICDLGEDEDFTLVKPPDSRDIWFWIDNKWTADDTAN